MAQLNDLPDELLRRVVSFTTPSHAPASLCQLLILSNRFSAVCRPLLYNTIAARPGNDTQLADVAYSPKLSKLVQKLDVAFPFAAHQSRVKHGKEDMPQTKLVQYDVQPLSSQRISAMHHFANLTRLDISFTSDQGTLSSDTTEAWPTIDYILTPYVDSLLTLPFLKNLTYLSLSSPSNIAIHYAQLRSLLQLMPRLDTLDLAGPDPEHLLTVPMPATSDLRRLLWKRARFTGEFEDESPLFGGSSLLFEITAIEFHDTDFTAADMRDVGLPQLCNILNLVQSHMRQSQNLDDISSIFPNIQTLSIIDVIVSPEPRHSLSQILQCQNAVFLELRTLDLSFALGGDSSEALDNFLASLHRLLQPYHFPVLQACAIEIDITSTSISALQWLKAVHKLADWVAKSSCVWDVEYRMVCKVRYVTVCRDREGRFWSEQGSRFGV